MEVFISSMKLKSKVKTNKINTGERTVHTMCISVPARVVNKTSGENGVFKLTGFLPSCYKC